MANGSTINQRVANRSSSTYPSSSTSTGVARRRYRLVVPRDSFFKSMYDFNFAVSNGGMKIAYMLVEILIPS